MSTSRLKASKHIHVSGHGSEEELKLVLSLVRPKYFVPVHGEYRQLSRHARVAGLVSSGFSAGSRSCWPKTEMSFDSMVQKRELPIRQPQGEC